MTDSLVAVAAKLKSFYKTGVPNTEVISINDGHVRRVYVCMCVCVYMCV